MAPTVNNNRQASRYELFVDDQLVGIADYRIVGDKVVMPHTEIDARRRGQGLGAILVRAALDDLRASGRAVLPRCWYVAQYIEEHPEFRDLVAA